MTERGRETTSDDAERTRGSIDDNENKRSVTKTGMNQITANIEHLMSL